MLKIKNDPNITNKMFVQMFPQLNKGQEFEYCITAMWNGWKQALRPNYDILSSKCPFILMFRMDCSIFLVVSWLVSEQK